MSVMAVGPALDLDGPLPRPPRYRLLSVPGVVVEGGDQRWMNGVNVNGYPEGTPSAWEPCSTGTFRVKEEDSEHSEPRFDVVGLYLPVKCSSMSYGNNWPELSARAEKALEATISFGVEHALSQGVDGSTNPFLADGSMTDVTTTPGTPVSPSVGLSLLEDAIGATGRAGMIHATPGVAAAWGFDKLETGETLYTVNGTPVAVGGGYLGTDPVSGDTPADEEAWAFATGPVEVRLSGMSVIDDDISGSLDREINEVIFRAEQYVLYTWDTALQAGVLIDWSPA